MRAYLDNAATTPIASEVIETVCTLMKSEFGNPSSTHYFGRQAKAILETSRRSIAKTIHCQPGEIIFTSGGTEADNIAIHTALANGVQRIITTKIEHHAVGHTVEHLKNEYKDIVIHFLNVNEYGQINLTELSTLLSDGIPTLVSLMHANNEIGTLIDLKQVGSICKQYNALFHSDTVQTMGHYPFNLADTPVDFITCAAHKFHGPKGVGFLYCSKALKPQTLIHGGAQERGFRGGTENLHNIAGLSKAIELAYTDLEEHQVYVQGIKSYMLKRLKESFPTLKVNGSENQNEALYTVLNVQLPSHPTSSMLLFTLDLKGVACSGGSACSSGSTKGSHVLEGIGASSELPSVRFSFSRFTTKEEIDFAVEQLQSIYAKA